MGITQGRKAASYELRSTSYDLRSVGAPVCSKLEARTSRLSSTESFLPVAIAAFDIIFSRPYPLMSDYESPRHRQRRTRARLGVEAPAVAPSRENLLRSGE